MCDSKELLVSFLYNEIDPADEAGVRAASLHVQRMPRGAGGARRYARAQIGAVDAAGCRPRVSHSPRIEIVAARPWFRFSPAWGLAAAAVLLLAIGAAIANLDVRYGSDGLVVRTGWNHAVRSTPASAARRRHAGGLEGAGAINSIAGCAISNRRSRRIRAGRAERVGGGFDRRSGSAARARNRRPERVASAAVLATA